MTKDKDFKRVVRDRATKTGESYAAARRAVAGPQSQDPSLAFARDQLAGSLYGFWNEFRDELGGMTDEEYLWEPVAGCPTIRRRDDGTWSVDQQFPPQGAASIAQRMVWVAHLLTVRANQHFGDKSVTGVAEVPATAGEGIALFEKAYTSWREGVETCDPARLTGKSDNRAPGSIDGMFTLMQVIEHQFQLTVQCCAHVSMTRGLYAART